MPEPPTRPTPKIEDFLSESTRSLEDWLWLWEGDRQFPIESHRGPLGRLVVSLKRLLRPLVKTPQNDLWDRQRIFNLVLLSHMLPVGSQIRDLRVDNRDAHQRLANVEDFQRHALNEVMEHNDALFSLVEQKLDRYQRDNRVIWGRLAGALAKVEGGELEEISEARSEAAYLELERLFRGTEREIEERTEIYLPYLEGRGEVLDLGCGRGEALAVLARHGITARGVDSNAEMTAACAEKGVAAETGDLFEVLAAVPENSLGGVVSFHVIEHLPPRAIDRLVRLAWRALASGGVLILETPNPLSLIVAARSFWLDPTHQRPVHPDSLKLIFELAGFEAVERIDLRAFPAEDRLPDVDVEALPEGLRDFGQELNRMRDQLDELLYGYQDFGMIGTKP